MKLIRNAKIYTMDELGTLDKADILIEEPSLDEIFMHFYKEGEV